jgi:cytochrome c peroxidase
VKALALLLLLAGCPKSNEHKKTIEPTSDNEAGSGRQLLPNDAASAIVTLPPAPAVPTVPFGVPPVPAGVLDHVTPEAIAMGEALFSDPRIAANAKTTCASCHDPANRYNGVAPRRDKITTERMPPQLENLAWNAHAIEHLPAHFANVMLQDLATAATQIERIPGYQAHIARVGGTPAQAVEQSIIAFVITRFDGNSPWDHQERTKSPPGDLAAEGYKIFTGKGRCATCHTPPLYTDLREHATGFATPRITRSLRGSAERKTFFFYAQAVTLDDVIDWYSADHPGSELHKIALAPPERAALLAFLKALTGTVPTAFLQPLP